MTQLYNSDKSQTIAVIPNNFPHELMSHQRWLLWRWETVKGGPTKVPYQAKDPEVHASSDKPTTWGDWPSAVETLVKDKTLHGLGYVFSGDLPLAGVDLDDCVHDGVIETWAWDIVTMLNSYTELTPSGTGLHVIVQGQLPCNWKYKFSKGEKKGVEGFRNDCYLTVTGKRLECFPSTIQARQDALDALHAQYGSKAENSQPKPPKPASDDASHAEYVLEDDDLIRTAGTDHVLWSRMFYYGWEDHLLGFPSQSEADLSFCTVLAQYTDDAAQIDRIMERSALSRTKWDGKYRDGTIQKAIDASEYAREERRATAEECRLAADEEQEQWRQAQTKFNEWRQAQAQVTGKKSLRERGTTLTDFLTLDFPIEWLVEHRLQRSHLCLLSAAAKAGKTTWVTQILLEWLLSGQTMGKPAANVPMVYLAWENQASYLQRLCKITTQYYGDPKGRSNDFVLFSSQHLGPKSERVPPFLTADYLHDLTADEPPGVLVVDTFRAAFSKAPNLPPKFEDDAATVGRLLRPIGEFCYASKWNVIIIHHHNKGGTASGSTEFAAAVDFIMDLKRDDNIADMSFSGRLPPDVQLNKLYFRWEKGIYRYCGEKDPDDKSKNHIIVPIADALVDILKMPSTVKDAVLLVKERIPNAAKNVIEDVAKDLVKHGILFRDADKQTARAVDYETKYLDWKVTKDVVSG